MSKYVLFSDQECDIKVMENATLDEIIRSQLKDVDDKQTGFYVIDIGAVRKQYSQWVAELPRVKPYFAIKCNPNHQFIRLLGELGANFDCASLAEIETVLALGFTPDRIIYANPCKIPKHIERAMQLGVNTMTFDNLDEVSKIAKINPNAKLVLRIATDDKNALCKFSCKFGAQAPNWLDLVKEVKAQKLDLIGFSFHVGSGSSDDKVYPATLREVKKLFDIATAEGFKPTLIDIGGGFPGEECWKPTFKELAAGIRSAIAELFPDEGIKFIAEPGRYFVEHSHILFSRIIARRFSEADTARGNNVLYYIDDGTYQSFNCMANDHYIPSYIIVSKDGRNDESWKDEVAKRKVYTSTVFGPTCDSIDTLYKDVKLPLYEIGEWFVFPNMGAYTVSPSVAFNGLIIKDFRYIDTNPRCISDHTPSIF